jgi:predicted O-methyltransferase YrrM
MTEIWGKVDEFVRDTVAPEDEALRAALEDAEAAGLPAIQVPASQGKLLQLLARAIGARRALEFGTLGGYSTIWLARGLPEDGRLISLEADPRFADVAEASIERAGLAERVEVRRGPALEALPRLNAEGAGPFDIVFIDADKIHTPDYFAWSLEHTRPGGLIVADNVVRDGSLAEPGDDETAHAQRRLHEAIAADSRVSATTVQTVGVKGYDGFTIALVG